MVGAGRNPRNLQAPLASEEVINLESPPPSYHLATHQPHYDVPKLTCPRYSSVVNTILLALLSYLVYAETYWGETILKRSEPLDNIITTQCQKPLDMVYKEILYGDPDTCPYRNNLTNNVQLNVCKPFKHRVLIDIRLFHQGLPTNEGLLIDPVDFTYMISNLKPYVLDQLQELLRDGL